jgi:hypothetical protein
MDVAADVVWREGLVIDWVYEDLRYGFVRTGVTDVNDCEFGGGRASGD